MAAVKHPDLMKQAIQDEFALARLSGGHANYTSARLRYEELARERDEAPAEKEEA